ncbi:helix-turn-helix domain-containing protein [Salisediminibacterium selenitireducens]|uniref:helix-turn-helix domain-containing protein n=1 Tax=Salisediminibacterium selenitireducens TaxID=85683 RepID=UPI00015F8602|nr:RodZ family helix-turn-helix domain-containing protein [Salisediminibacterium selenitireducens]
MSELGVRLQNARIEKGISLDELQQKTKIQKRYLEAIENGDFSKMPGDFYARAFVKSYCEAVGLSVDQVFEEHAGELPKAKKESGDLPPRIDRPKSRPVKQRSAFSRLLPSLIVLLFLIGIVSTLWFTNLGDSSDNDSSTREEQQSQPSVDITDDLNEDNDEEDTGETEEPDNSISNGNNTEETDASEEESQEEEIIDPSLEFVELNDAGQYVYSLSDADSFDLEMIFSGGSWIQINDDSGTVHTDTHGDGDEISFDFTGESEILIRLGFIHTAEILVNDIPLEYQSDNDVQNILILHEDSVS